MTGSVPPELHWGEANVLGEEGQSAREVLGDGLQEAGVRERVRIDLVPHN